MGRGVIACGVVSGAKVIRLGQFGSSYSGMTVLVAGAAGPVGTALVAHLAAQGATVVALDPDPAPLMAAAHQHPDRVEPLAIDLRNAALAGDIGAIWGDEPLHGFVSLLGLDAPDDLVLSCRAPVALLRAFAPGLRAGHGAALLVWPYRGASPEDAAHQAGTMALTDAADREAWAPPGGVHMVELSAPLAAPALSDMLALLLTPRAARFRGGRFRLAQVS